MNQPTYEQQLNDTRPSYCFPSVIENCFSPEEVAQLAALANEDSTSVGAIGSNQEEHVDLEVRRSRILRLDTEKYAWVMQRLAQLAETANQRYNFDLTNAIMEPVQIAIYDASDEGFYTWHTDIGMTSLTRKLSISIPLNEPTEYEGGELEFNMGTPVAQPQKAGSAVIFPSYILHRVAPVTSGQRFSMVTWIHGPKWR